MEERKRQDNRRRRKPNQFEIFKQNYLPALIICVAFILILTFTIGSITRAIQHNKAEQLRKEQAQLSAQQAQEQLEHELAQLIEEAEKLASDYDYAGAIAVLDTFSGDETRYEQIGILRQQYEEANANMVLWEDNSQVLNLSFQLLIADPDRAFSDTTYGISYKNNFITTSEFSNILLQLYQNDYVLISLDDIYTTETDDFGQTYLASKELYLPVGKKPVILTQTQVNYNTYMVDSDGDMMADKDGDGFASKMIVDTNGNITCEIVNSDGSVSTGAYDLVPILDSFIATHPDFSYNGAKAILAVTGYDGLFGYRTTAAADAYFGTMFKEEQIQQVSEVIGALRNSGYDIACYTYENLAYGTAEMDVINADMSKWETEVLPILGETDIFVFAKNSDITDSSSIYIGEKYNKLSDMGFKYYIGFCESGTPWQILTDNYVRQGRIMVTGQNLTNNQSWFNGIFDAASVLDSARN